jgi:hypothetical protein
VQAQIADFAVHSFQITRKENKGKSLNNKFANSPHNKQHLSGRTIAPESERFSQKMPCSSGGLAEPLFAEKKVALALKPSRSKQKRAIEIQIPTSKLESVFS